MKNLAFLRVPKTGTSSIVNALLTEIDDDNFPCLTKDHQTAATFAEHGHDHAFITMVRDPLQTYVSAYYFIRNLLNRNTKSPYFEPTGVRGALGQLVYYAQNLDLEEFLLRAPANDFMAKYYAGVNIDDFVFVGVVDEMADSIRVLSAIMGRETSVAWHNRNPKRPATLQPYYVSPETTKLFIERNAAEYELYERGLARFSTLRGEV